MRRYRGYVGFGFPGRFWKFGPMGGSARFFDSGEVRLAILSLLKEGPKHGYQLMKEMEERSGGTYRASAGSIYPTLQLLEDEGLVEAEQQDGRRVYRLTKEGREELGKDPESVRRIWERAETWEDWGQCLDPESFLLLKPAAAVLKATMRAARRTAGRADAETRIRRILEQALEQLESVR